MGHGQSRKTHKRHIGVAYFFAGEIDQAYASRFDGTNLIAMLLFGDRICYCLQYFHRYVSLSVRSIYNYGDYDIPYGTIFRSLGTMFPRSVRNFRNLGLVR